jgi:hypothetical protein
VTLKLLSVLVLLGGVVRAAQGSALAILAESPIVSVSLAESSATVALRVHNLGDAEESLFIWQSGLSLVPGASATGEVMIASYGVPQDYILNSKSLFGPMPTFGAVLPASSVQFSDAAFGALAGGVIPAGGSAGLLQVELAFTPDYSGNFHLVLNAMSSDFLVSSSWSTTAAQGTPLPFANGTAALSQFERTLVTITRAVTTEPPSINLFLAAFASIVLARRARLAAWRRDLFVWQHG